jgi:outer membrane lipoprotein
MRHIPAITTFMTLALAGCATVPAPIAGNDFAAVTPEQAVSQHAGNAHVRWGGEIIKAEPMADATCFEVLARDLYPDARPNRHDNSDGRFIACGKGFYDPAIYTKGRDLTVVGQLAGTEQHQVGGFNYTYAHVDADQVYLWPKRQYAAGYYPGWPYYPDPLFGPYYGFWGPPVIVVRAHH